MPRAVGRSDARVALHDLGRGMVGALLFGAPVLFTMETWWLGRTLHPAYVLGYVVVGLLLVLGLLRVVGFRDDESPPVRPPRLAVDFALLLLEALLAAFVVLLALGVLRPGDSLVTMARVALLQVVPLGLGAAIANRLLGERHEEDPETHREGLARNVGLFALGAVFYTFPLAPTEEVELLASSAGWVRMPFLVALSVVVTYLSLYVLEFRGHHRRVQLMPQGWLRWGEACLGYATAFAAGALMLLAFGHFSDGTFATWLQDAVVLAFPAALGGSAARVVL